MSDCPDTSNLLRPLSEHHAKHLRGVLATHARIAERRRREGPHLSQPGEWVSMGDLGPGCSGIMLVGPKRCWFGQPDRGDGDE